MSRPLPTSTTTTTTTPALLPSGPDEWRRAVDEVRRRYAARRYRSCALRCNELLDGLRDHADRATRTAAADVEEQDPHHAVRRISLHFYAASSLEWCARPLSAAASSYRATLLRDARAHYDAAAALLAAAEAGMSMPPAGRRSSASGGGGGGGRGRSCSPALSSASSSPSSSVASLSCGSWDADASSGSSSAASSPRTSIFSFDCGNGNGDGGGAGAGVGARRPKKKVSFRVEPELIVEARPEPYIRPDSPTLGWEDDEDSSIGGEEADEKPLPSPPQQQQHQQQQQMLQSALKRHHLTESPREDEEDATLPSSIPAMVAAAFRFGASCDYDDGDHDREHDHAHAADTPDLDAFPRAPWSPRSSGRIRAQLTALRSQVAWHRDGVDALLLDRPSSSSSNIKSSSHKSSNSINSITSTISTSSSTSSIRDDGFPPRSSSRLSSLWADQGEGGGEGGGEGKAATEDLRARIERLRTGGWRRRRFDSRRYEALREQVLGELEGA
ncbi:hypothetical protein GGR56DRAFT_685514 [Xylariaceae sp. FL0804]|nr:hypothetical protein GGR56DRAFT_685514 [Xylariaceae sp. FL0804]